MGLGLIVTQSILLRIKQELEVFEQQAHIVIFFIIRIFVPITYINFILLRDINH